jgi:hypothetical protein
MDSDEEVSVVWDNTCDTYLIEDWVRNKSRLFQYVREDYKPQPVKLDAQTILLTTEYQEKPWKRPGADESDWFNFGFNEDSWKEMLMVQILLRREALHKQEEVAREDKLRELDRRHRHSRHRD